VFSGFMYWQETETAVWRILSTALRFTGKYEESQLTLNIYKSKQSAEMQSSASSVWINAAMS
jgi:hypothetical protein